MLISLYLKANSSFVSFKKLLLTPGCFISWHKQLNIIEHIDTLLKLTLVEIFP